MFVIKLLRQLSQLDYLAVIAASCLFMTLQPYFIWGTKYEIIAQFIYIAIVAIKIEKNNKAIFAGILMCLLYVYLIYKNNFSIFGVISIITFFPLFFVNRNYSLTILRYFSVLFSLVCAISLCMYILVVFFNSSLPYTIIDSLNKGKHDTFYKAYFMLVFSNSYGIDSTRFFGPFDEPGVIGNVSAILLIISKLNLKKWNNIILFIAGFFSFSMFFYILISIYLILFAGKKIKILSSSLIICSIYLPVVTDNELLNLYVMDRVTSGDVDNRTSDNYDKWFVNFSKTDCFYYGKGGGISAKYNPGGASYKDIIVDYGIVFFIFYIACLLGMSYPYLKRKNILLYFVIILAILYQRPFITLFGYLYLLYIPQIGLSNKEIWHR